MDDSHVQMLRTWASAFRTAIEVTRAQRIAGALPYFPEGACRLTSRLFAQYLALRSHAAGFGRAQLVSGILPGSEHAARHYWLEVDDVVIDLAADPFGEAPVVVGSRTAFHQSLESTIAEDAAASLATLSADEAARLARQLATIESRLSWLPTPAA